MQPVYVIFLVLASLQAVIGGYQFAHPRLVDTDLLLAKEDKILGLINTVKEKQLALRDRLDTLENTEGFASFTKDSSNRDILTNKQLNHFLRKLSGATVKISGKRGWFDDVVDAVVDVGEDIGGAVVDAGEAVGGAVVDAGEAVGGAVVDAGEAVGGFVTDVWDEFVDWAAGPIGDLVDYADEIAYFFNNVASTIEDFISNLVTQVDTCFSDLGACMKNIYESVLRPVLEKLRDRFLGRLNNGPGIGGPVAVWQGLAHQFRLGDTGKCLSYQQNGGSYTFDASDCLDPKTGTSQDFKLTPCDSCHDTKTSFFDILELLLRFCNVGDVHTSRNWSMLIEISAFGHVITRGRTTTVGDRVRLDATAPCMIFPLSIFTRVIDLKADVHLLSNGDINFSITSLSSSPESSFVDTLLNPLETSFTIPASVGGFSVNPGGFQNYASSFGRK